MISKIVVFVRYMFHVWTGSLMNKRNPHSRPDKPEQPCGLNICISNPQQVFTEAEFW